MPLSLPACTQPLRTPTWATEFLRRHDWMPIADGTWKRLGEPQQERLDTCAAVNYQVTLLEIQLIRALTLQRAYSALLALDVSSAPLVVDHFGHPWMSGFVGWLADVAGGARALTDGEGRERQPTEFERARARQLELGLRSLGVSRVPR